MSSSRPCLEGGRGLEPLDPRSGKPDARPGTDASSRAIFTNQWMQRRSRSWNWSCCSSLPARRAQPGWRDPGGSRGSARNSGTLHTARGFLPTPSLRVSSPSESTEKPIKALSAEKPGIFRSEWINPSCHGDTHLHPKPFPRSAPSFLDKSTAHTHQIPCGKNKMIKVELRYIQNSPCLSLVLTRLSKASLISGS